MEPAAHTYQIAERWNSSFLATRDRGRRVREDVEQEISKLNVGKTLALDFAGVEGVTVSFGDELLAKLVIDRATGQDADRGLVIEGANEDVRETLETVLMRRKVAAVNIDADGQPEVLGGPGWLPQTLAVAVELRSFSAAELAERLSLTPQAANNRLNGLVATGGVVRERIVPEGGGKEFGYRVAIPAYA
ncbi:MAG TPA: DUF4325 domain-containing protein [Solirubrobacterales bacterium]